MKRLLAITAIVCFTMGLAVMAQAKQCGDSGTHRYEKTTDGGEADGTDKSEKHNEKGAGFEREG